MSFPSNPNDNDIVERFGRRFRYKSSKGVWDIVSSPTVAPIQEAAPTTSSVTQAVDLPMSGNEIGAMSYVQESNRLYVWNGTGWFEIALVNTNPTITDGGQATYELNSDGTPTVITLTANDPEEVPLTWSYAVSSGSLEDTTITNVDNVFTITPGTIDATFNLTFTASDGVNIDTSVSSFTLTFGFAGNILLAPTSYEYALGVLPDTSNFGTGNFLITGDRPGRLAYLPDGSSTTAWVKKYADYYNWTGSSRAFTAAFDDNWIYTAFTGKDLAARINPGFDVIKINKNNGDRVGDAFIYLHMENSNYTVTYIDSALDQSNNTLYVISGLTSNRWWVQALNASDLSFKWARGRILSSYGEINKSNNSKCAIVQNGKLAFIYKSGTQGVYLDEFDTNGNQTNGWKIANDGTLSIDSLYYYDGKYYCLIGQYNSSLYVSTARLIVVDRSTGSATMTVLRPGGSESSSNYGDVYVDSTGIYVTALRYLMKLSLNDLTPVGCWLTTTDGTALATPGSTWRLHNGIFNFGIRTSTNFKICTGSLDGSNFGVQYDYFNLAPVASFTATTSALTTSATDPYSNIGSSGYVGYSTLNNYLTITSQANWTATR